MSFVVTATFTSALLAKRARSIVREMQMNIAMNRSSLSEMLRNLLQYVRAAAFLSTLWRSDHWGELCSFHCRCIAEETIIMKERVKGGHGFHVYYVFPSNLQGCHLPHISRSPHSTSPPKVVLIYALAGVHGITEVPGTFALFTATDSPAHCLLATFFPPKASAWPREFSVTICMVSWYGCNLLSSLRWRVDFAGYLNSWKVMLFAVQGAVSVLLILMFPFVPWTPVTSLVKIFLLPSPTDTPLTPVHTRKVEHSHPLITMLRRSIIPFTLRHRLPLRILHTVPTLVAPPCVRLLEEQLSRIANPTIRDKFLAAERSCCAVADVVVVFGGNKVRTCVGFVEVGGVCEDFDAVVALRNKEGAHADGGVGDEEVGCGEGGEGGEEEGCDEAHLGGLCKKVWF